MLVLVAAAVGAGPTVQVVGLFENHAVIRIDGHQRVLSVGQTSPEGVRLVAANSRAAVLEVGGRKITLGLSRTIGGHYTHAPEEEVRIYRTPPGMYRTVGSINGQPVDFLVDTGASQVAMNAAEADRLGLDFRVDGDPREVVTASGYARAFRVKLDSVKVGPIELHDVDAVVLDGDHPRQVLLGMSFLGRLEMENTGDALVLRQKY